MRLAQRLARLETIWPEPDDVISEGDIGSLTYWSSPVALPALWDWSALRAHLRCQHEAGDWWKLTREHRDERIRFEVAEFCRLLDELGPEDGYVAWHHQAEPWRSQHGPCDVATFERRIHHALSNADQNRAHPSSWLFRRVWSEWRSDMTDEERLSFDTLLARECETRLAPYVDSPIGVTNS